MQLPLRITIPKGFMLVVKHLKDGTFELSLEPIRLRPQP
jgi:hypothetical protein